MTLCVDPEPEAPRPDTAEVRLRVARLSGFAYRFTREADLHARLQTVLTEELDLRFQHEVTVGLSRYDFLLEGGVALEVKIAGSLADALRQARRYCADPQVTAVVVAATCRWARTPTTIDLHGKPVTVLYLPRVCL